MYNEVHVNKQDVLATVCGGRGCGKSTATLGHGCRLDPTFADAVLEDPGSRIVFTAEQYSNLFLSEKKTGTFVMFEEAGMEESGDHRKWQKVENDVLKYIAQTQRWHRLFVFFTVPDFGLLDKDLRRFFKYYIEVKGWFEDYHNASLEYVFELKHDHFTGKTFPTYLEVLSEGHWWKLSEGILVPQPPKNVMDAYDRYSHDWKDDNEKKQNNKLKPKVVKNTEFSPQDAMLQIWENREKYLKPGGGYDQTQIELDLRIGRVHSTRVIRLLRTHEQELNNQNAYKGVPTTSLSIRLNPKAGGE